MIKLTEENFLLFAMHNYDKVSVVSIEEFEEDLGRFLSVKRLLTRYHTNKNDLKERLLLNHVVVLYNMFGQTTTNMLFYRVPKDHWPALASVLLYLNRLPETIVEHGIISSELQLDNYLLDKLKEL